MEKVLKELRRILNNGIKAGDSYSDIEKAMKRVLDAFNVNGQKDALLGQMKKQYDWVTDKTQLALVRDDVNEILSTAGSQYAMTKKGLQSDIAARIKPLLKKGADKKDLRNEIESIIGKARNRAETIARTAISGFDGTDSIVQAEKAGLKKFTYAGPPAERGFCKALLDQTAAGKSWTAAEIRAMNNGQGLDVLIYKGGYNCRHWWEAEEEK